MQSYEFLKAWRERARLLQAQVPAPAMPTSLAVEGALLTGDPLITVSEPQMPPEMVAEALVDLAGLLAEHQPGDESLSLADAMRQAGPADRAALVDAMMGEGNLQEWATARNVSPEILGTLASLAIQPFMAKFASTLTEEIALGTWRRNYCPVCGTKADVCRIDPENARYLHCPTCDTQWEHHRLACVNCDTDDVKRVHILTVEEIEPWRVELCDVCGAYTKTLDQRHGGHLSMPKVDLFLEDARTMQLNLLAEQEGYRRGGRQQ